MFLLIRNSGRCRRGYARNLHSTMFLLIQMEPWRLTYRECNLHSTMFLLILVLIPCLISLFVFTFHNVSINSMVCLIEIAAERRFTFHNVSINSAYWHTPKYLPVYLHSTMFLLIRSSPDSFLVLWTEFTFHNVSINSTIRILPFEGQWIYIPQCFY